PDDTTCSASNPDTLRCPAGSRGKSTARRSSPDIGPNKRTSGDDNHRRRGSHIFETPCDGDGRSTLRTRTDQYASSIVSLGADSLSAPTFGHFGFQIVPAEKGRHPKAQKGLVGIRKVLYRTLMEASLRDSGVAWTNLHPNMFMQNLLTAWAVNGGLYSVYTSKPIGFSALEDVAEAAAVILMEGPAKHRGK